MAKSSFQHGKSNVFWRRMIVGGLVAVLVASVVLIVAVVLRLTDTPAPAPAGSSTPDPTASTTAEPTSPPTLPAEEITDSLYSRQAIVYDATHDVVLYEKGGDAVCYPASLTKMLTGAVALEYLSPDAVLPVGDEIDLKMWDASCAYIQKGSELTVSELLEALLLPSGADAAYCLAVNTARIATENPDLPDEEAVEVFCRFLNETAAQIGATHTHFVNPDGYNDNDHYSTPADLVKIAQYAQSFPEMKRIMGLAETDSYRNSNLLLKEDGMYYYSAATGLKTGSTDEAGYCLAASVEKDGVELIGIFLDSGLSEGRYIDAISLFDQSFTLLGVTPPAHAELDRPDPDASVGDAGES